MKLILPILIFVAFPLVVISQVSNDSTPNKERKLQNDEEKLVTQTFNVPLNFLELIEPPEQKDIFPHGDLFSEQTPPNQHGFLGHLGIRFGPNHQALFNPEAGTFTVTTTEQQLKTIADLVSTLPKLSEEQELAFVSSIIQVEVEPSEVENAPELRDYEISVKKIEDCLQSFRIENLRLHNHNLSEVLNEIQKPLNLQSGMKDVFFWIQGPPATIKSVDLQNVTLDAALLSILQPIGYKFEIQPPAIAVVPKTYQTPALITTKFILPPAIAEKFMSQKLSSSFLDPFAPRPELNSVNKQISPKQIFENAGISFVAGAWVRFTSESGELIIQNTPNQLDLVHSYLSALDGNRFIFSKESRFHKK